MNPILATTLEFDSYVKEKLQASRIGVQPRTSLSNSKSKGAAVSEQARIPSTKSISARSNSASIQNRNANRYAMPTAASSSTSHRASFSNPAPSPPTFEIAHSWRAHVVRPNSAVNAQKVTIPTLLQQPPHGDYSSRPAELPTPPSSSNHHRNNNDYNNSSNSSIISAKRSLDRRYDSKYDDEIADDSDYMPAPPYLDFISDSFTKHVSVSTVSPRSIYSTTSGTPHHQQEVASMYTVKIRIFRLKKLFRAWRTVTLQSAPLLARFARGVMLFCQESLMIHYFDAWKHQWLAINFHRNYAKYHLRKRLLAWNKRTQRILQRKQRIQAYHAKLAFQKWHALILMKHRQLKKKERAHNVRQLRAKSLLLRMMKQWKRVHRSQKHVKEVEESRQTTMGRIQSFLQRLDSAPAKHNDTSTNTAGNTSSRHTGATARSANRTSTTTTTTVNNSANAPNRANSATRRRPTTNTTTTTTAAGKENPASSTTSNGHLSPEQRQKQQKELSSSTSHSNYRNHSNHESDGLPPSPSKKKTLSSQQQSTNVVSESKRGEGKDDYDDNVDDGDDANNQEDNEDDLMPRQALPRPLTPFIHPNNYIRTSINSSNDNNNDPAPPSYRYFTANGEGKSADHQAEAEGFPVVQHSTSHTNRHTTTTSTTLNSKSTAAHSKTVSSAAAPGNAEETQILAQFTSRKERLAYLQQRAQERVQRRRDEAQRQQELKLQQEAEAANQVLQEVKKKKQEAHSKTLQSRQEMSQLQSLVPLADAFRRTHLLVQYGWSPWMRYLHRQTHRQGIATQFATRQLLLRYWQQLFSYVQTLKTERIRTEYKQSLQASHYYKRRLLRSMFKTWKLYGKLLRAKARALTGHFSRKTLPKRVFHAWKIAFSRSQRQAYTFLMTEIQPRGDKIRKQYYWARWVEYLQNKRVENEVNHRSEMKWQAVRSWMKK